MTTAQTTMVGFHFRFQLRMNWAGLVAVFDERALQLGCPPPGPALRPWAARATVSGTIDGRLRQGGRRYDVVLYSQEHVPLDVQLGLTDQHPRVRFRVDPGFASSWCSSDTLGLSSAGIFVPEQRTMDGKTTLPAVFVARLDLWPVLMQVANIASGAPVPENKELPGAPGWTFEGSSGADQPELIHALAGLSFTITPMEV